MEGERESENNSTTRYPYVLVRSRWLSGPSSSSPVSLECQHRDCDIDLRLYQGRSTPIAIDNDCQFSSRRSVVLFGNSG